jgi:hypothetical protein
MKSCKKFVQNCDGHATHAICTIFMDQNILAMHHLVVAIRKMPQKYFHFGFHRGQTHQSNQRESPNLQSSMNLPVIGMKPVSMKSRVGQASAILSPDNSSKLGKRGSPIMTTSASQSISVRYGKPDMPLALRIDEIGYSRAVGFKENRDEVKYGGTDTRPRVTKTTMKTVPVQWALFLPYCSIHRYRSKSG